MMSRIQSSLSFMMKTDYFGFNLVTRLTYPPIPPPLLPPSPLPFSPFSSPPLLSHSLFCFPAKIILRCWSCHSIKSTLERPQPDSLACVTIASHFKFLIINFLYNLVTKSFSFKYRTQCTPATRFFNTCSSYTALYYYSFMHPGSFSHTNKTVH